MVDSYDKTVLEKLQGIELEILLVIDSLCSKQGIDYFLDSGSCLGAVRHGGFIPWDDDIDIGMPYDDYTRFIAVAEDLLPEGYSLHTPQNTDPYPPLFAKVYRDGTRFISHEMACAGCEQGVFIDVFPFCQLDARPEVAGRQMRNAVFWQRVSYLYHIAHPKIPKETPLRPVLGFLCTVAHGILRVFMRPATIWKRFSRSFVAEQPSDTWCSICYTQWGTFSTETLFPTNRLSFCGHLLPVPHDTDTFLSTYYGDYMELPPDDMRVPVPPEILDI